MVFRKCMIIARLFLLTLPGFLMLAFASQSEAESGTVWTKDEKGGFVAANTPATREATGQLRSSLPRGASTLGALRLQMAEIEGLTGGDKSFRLAALKGGVAEFLARKKQGIIALADQESGVPALTQALEDNIRMDRNHPTYFAKYGTKDSDETAQVRQQLQHARTSSAALATKYIATDPEIAAVTGEFDFFITAQASLAAQDSTRELEKEERENAAKEAAAQARQEAEERALETTEKAEQAAEELRNEMLRSSIKTKNSIYLGVLLLAISGFVIYFISRNNKKKPYG